jgi:putative membrane protein
MTEIWIILIVWLVTSVGLLIICKLPLGVEIDTLNKALISAAVIGILTTIVRPILHFVFTVTSLLTLNWLADLFTFMISVVCFSVAAWLIDGFRLRYGIWSAVMGSLALTIIQNFAYQLLGV